jgi:hypothetical protein
MDAEIVLTISEGPRKVTKTLRMGGDLPQSDFLEEFHSYVQTRLGALIEQLAAELKAAPVTPPVGSHAKRPKSKPEENANGETPKDGAV